MNVEEIDLCPFCSDLVKSTTDSLIPSSQCPHYPTYGLILSSSEKCTICRTITSLWGHIDSILNRHEISKKPIRGCRDEFSVKITTKVARRMPSGASWTLLEASLGSTHTGLTSISYFTLVSCLLGDPISSSAFWRSPTTTFDSKLLAIQSWMFDCESQNGHSKCRPVPFAPLRLLTVGLDGKPLRLVERDTTTIRTDYAALSYCWGNSLQLRTTKGTLTIFSKEVPSKLIPRTFADAIHIARALRIPYIWIDALCIVQDDEQEWQSEATHMSEIYRGSQLTITATESVDSLQGCFPPEKPGLHSAGLFFRTRPNGLDDRSSLVRIYRNDIRDSVVEDSVISTRGWTLQEQLLSPRLVFCMQPDMHWKCQCNYQTQSGLSFEPRMAPDRGGLFLDLNHRLDDLWYRSSWRRIIEGYSLREFTFSQDRVPAIAGMTRYFASTLEDVPILGLWVRSFARDLAWLRGGGRQQMSNTSGLPSWTWLACQGCVLYTIGSKYADYEVQVVEHLKLLNWDVQWQGTPYASPVELAQVKVEGPVREIEIRPFTEGSSHKPPYFQVFGEDLKPTVKTKFPWRCAGQFDTGDASEATIYLCLLLFSETKSSESNYTSEIFLILEPVEIHSTVKYKRIGMARIWGGPPTFNAAKTISMVLV
ncbi:HET-domain-containing protein [Hyaloscypha bicolor E]|uniref:HET-domain-containing protein n=1 Tax=Hyaloscypha bicolor E TaxID=1095630 RepID=A0A2J6T7A2_9HELO|nr:HET-domain-containing protein [Hyaloscypha bicolor E]PMD58888.1 HET-domain-containing protein [Hyaloscypha bicolor E]